MNNRPVLPIALGIFIIILIIISSSKKAEMAQPVAKDSPKTQIFLDNNSQSYIDTALITVRPLFASMTHNSLPLPGSAGNEKIMLRVADDSKENNPNYMDYALYYRDVFLSSPLPVQIRYGENGWERVYEKAPHGNGDALPDKCKILQY